MNLTIKGIFLNSTDQNELRLKSYRPCWMTHDKRNFYCHFLEWGLIFRWCCLQEHQIHIIGSSPKFCVVSQTTFFLSRTTKSIVEFDLMHTMTPSTKSAGPGRCVQSSRSSLADALQWRHGTRMHRSTLVNPFCADTQSIFTFFIIIFPTLRWHRQLKYFPVKGSDRFIRSS